MRLGLVLPLALCGCLPPLVGLAVAYRAPDGTVYQDSGKEPGAARERALLAVGAGDLACPPGRLTTATKGQMHPGPLLSILEGCGQRATYFLNCQDGPTRTIPPNVVCDIKLIGRVAIAPSTSAPSGRTALCPGVKQAAPIEATLPTPRHEAAVFSDGKLVYAAGGLNSRDGFLTEIIRFDPASGAITVMNEHLPNPTQAAGVAWTGQAAYLFGGRNQTGLLRQIVRYEPRSGSVKQMKAQLPVGAYSIGVVWTGSVFYLLGGFDGNDVNRILRYDPAADVITTVRPVLPVPAQAPAVLWDGKGVWILGGAAHGPSDAIQYFDPAAGKATRVGHLPYPVWVPASFYDGACLYLAGGAAMRSGYDSIIAFDPRTGQAVTLAPRLPDVISGRVATWVTSLHAAFLLGGEDPRNDAHTDEIIRLGP
jgi:hypothetical protein